MGTETAANRRRIKARGAHYTPPELARFLAEETFKELEFPRGTVRILDPACGDGSLLAAAVSAVPTRARARLHLVGLDTHAEAIAESRARLRGLGVQKLELRVADFLLGRRDVSGQQRQLDMGLPGEDAGSELGYFDAVIANPPYVRTQVLGSAQAQALAQSYGLSGRVDLYHAFLKAISHSLRPGGLLGLLTSNRFLVTLAGASMRESLQREFDLLQLIDLGDTKLFSAAVLPAIVIGRRDPRGRSDARFSRVYQVRNGTESPDAMAFASVLEAIRSDAEGCVRVDDLLFNIERGTLGASTDPNRPWALSSSESEVWRRRVESAAFCRFADVGRIRVGIKSTADAVFIRDDWAELPPDQRPEEELLKPLLTHREASRWRRKEGSHSRRVLYPHEDRGGKRATVELQDYPRARAYLECHRERLASRKYVEAAGRRWYEIWVPQQPRDWQRLKIVFPDISESPRFFLDDDGAVVNGDCYWITLLPGKSESWLHLMLAVANSTFIEQFYDRMFNNKLYAGRRRFLTQYVEKFPLPDPDSSAAKETVDLVRERLGHVTTPQEVQDLEGRIDALVWELFGFAEKADGKGNL